ncbi:MAG: putative Xaa-Pro dipeptidase [Candidatus Bathyarchaeota archaeon B26-2]|nr:MAG: putative Xaa-Pro dipeptidase [Candidatus Bathyarchaeota archaeon B26-2]
MAEANVKRLSTVAEQIIEETYPTIDRSIQITREEYKERWRKVQESMAAKGYDLLYVCGSELDRSDAAWLTGAFDPMIERYAVILPSEGRPIILAGSEGGHVLEESAERSGADIALLREFQISDEEYRWARFVGLREVLSRAGLSPNGLKVVVASPPDVLPHSQLRMLQSQFGEENVVFDPDLLRLIKYEKSEKELAIMQEANKVADAAMRGMLAVTIPGFTELQIASVGDFIMKALGAGRTGFVTIVTSGERGRTVIGPATNRVIRKGDIVSLGLSPTFNGYHGVVRRTVRAGVEPDPRQRRFIKAVEDLYVVVMDAVKEAAEKGLPSNYIDQQGKKYLENLRIETLSGELAAPHEPYTFVHNMGCSECQEGYGAVTPYTTNPLGRQVALAIDVALVGFDEKGELIFPVRYAVVEDAFWKKGSEVGVYNRLPLNVQHLVGNLEPIGDDVNPYHKEFPVT